MPRFVAPQLCRSVDKPPTGANWVHEIKLDGYRMQLRVENRMAAMRTRKGLDWTVMFAAVAEAARALPNAIIDGEVVALDATGAPDFSALQAALSEGRSGDLVYFAFDLLFAEGEDLRALPLSQRKQRLQKLLTDARMSDATAVRYLDHLSGPGDAVLQSACRHEPRRHHLQTPRTPLPLRAAPRPGPRPSAAPATRW